MINRTTTKGFYLINQVDNKVFINLISNDHNKLTTLLCNTESKPVSDSKVAIMLNERNNTILKYGTIKYFKEFVIIDNGICKSFHNIKDMEIIGVIESITIRNAIKN